MRHTAKKRESLLIIKLLICDVMSPYALYKIWNKFLLEPQVPRYYPLSAASVYVHTPCTLLLASHAIYSLRLYLAFIVFSCSIELSTVSGDTPSYVARILVHTHAYLLATMCLRGSDEDPVLAKRNRFWPKETGFGQKKTGSGALYLKRREVYFR